MILDIILLAVLAVWAVFGYRKGFIKQIFALAGVLCVVFFSAPLADILEKVLINEFGIVLTGRYLRAFLLMGCGSIIYVLAYVVGRFLHNTLVKGIAIAESTNHILGTVLGLAECALALYFILCLTSVGQNKIREYAPSAHEFITQSTSFKIADSNNLLNSYDFFKPAVTIQDGQQNVQNTKQAAPANNPPDSPDDTQSAPQDTIRQNTEQKPVQQNPDANNAIRRTIPRQAATADTKR